MNALPLVVPRAEADRLARWATEAYPREACGLLVGAVTTRGVVVVQAERAQNRARAESRDRFDLDPVDHVAIDARARRAGLEVVGVWHSHPDRPARPSELDRATAYDGWTHLIVGVRGSATSPPVAGPCTAWRLEHGEFVAAEVSRSTCSPDLRVGS